MNQDKIQAEVFNVLEKLSTRYFSITSGLLTIGIGLKLISHSTGIWWLRFLFSPHPLFGESIFTIWATLLAIHGTIAALSLTLNGALIDRVAEAFNPSLESIARKAVFKRLRFQSFSNWSISSLTIGIGWFALEGGIVLYFISMVMSISFLFFYAYVYRHLQKISISPSLIKEFVEAEIQDTKVRAKALNDKIEKVASNNLKTLTSLEIKPETSRKLRLRAISLPESHLGLIYSYNAAKLKAFIDIMNQKGVSDFVISVRPGQMDSDAPIRYPANILLDADEANLETAFLAALGDSVLGYDLALYDDLASQLQLNVYENAIRLTSQKDLVESLKWLFLLTDEDDIERTLDGFLHLFYENRANLPQRTSIVSNLKSAMTTSFHYNDTSALCTFLFKIAQDLLDPNSYIEFIKSESDFFVDFVIYSSQSELQLKKILYEPLVDISQHRLGAASEYIKVLSVKDRYYDLDSDTSQHQWNATVRVSFYLEALALLTLRLDAIGIPNGVDRERERIIDTIRSILNAEVFNELYYHEFIYHEIFKLRHGFSYHSAEANLRNIKDGSVYTKTSNVFFNQARALLLFGIPEGSQSFSIDFIRDVELLISKTCFNTWEAKNLLDYVSSDEYQQLLSLLTMETATNTDKINQFVDRVVGALNTFYAQLQALVHRQIVKAELDPSIKQNIFEEVTERFTKEISNLFPQLELLDINSNVKPEFVANINKRAFLPPIDRVPVANPSRNLAQQLMNTFISSMVDHLKKTEHTLISLFPEEVEQFTGHWITVINGEMQNDNKMPLGAYLKGYKLRDKNNTLGLCDLGLYYFQINSTSLSLAKTENKVISLEIVTADSPAVIDWFGDDLNSMKKDQAVFVKTKFNLTLRYTSPLSIYFLPAIKMKD
ncbi:hypothetical protein AB6E26_18165 [Vibrio splendidus]